MMKQKMGALRCGATFVVILRDNTWKQKWQKSVRAGVQSNKRKTRDQHTRGLAQSSHYSTKQPLRTHSLRHPGWTKAGFSEMAKSKPAVWDGALGSFKPIHPKYKEDLPWTWVATIRSDAPVFIMDQFRAMTSLHTEGVISIAAEREKKTE